MPERPSGPSMLALVKDRSGPALWRVFAPFRALAAGGYSCGYVDRSSAEIDRIGAQFEGYLLPRLSWPPAQRRLAERWISAARASGHFLVYDLDDDIVTSAITHRALEVGMADGRSFEQLEAERAERIWALQQCDGVTVSTARLATIVRSFTDRPVVVVPNAIDLIWFRSVVRATRRQISGLTVGWAGGARHDRDLAPMVEGWRRIAARFPDVRFVVQGHVPALIVDAVPAAQLVGVPWMSLETYPSGLAQVDVACCSVADTPFNRCKTPIKAYEATAAGSAVVATPTLYGQVVEHGKTGFIAETADEWEHALAELIARPSLRALLARRLLKTVERKHSLARELWRWPASWATIQADARSRRGRLVAV